MLRLFFNLKAELMKQGIVFFLCLNLIFCVRANNLSELQSIIKKHINNFDIASDDELVRNGATNPVTSVFYNIPITNTKLSATGISLNQSGRYYIANNLTRALNANAAYVTISGSNIILDMNSCSIQGNLQASSTTAKGISISTGVANIKILKGSVTNIQGNCIDVGTNCNSISIESVNTSKYLSNGVYFDDATKNIYVSDVHATTTVGSTPGTSYGLQLVNITDGIVENCSFNNSSSSNLSAGGVFINGCADIEFRNCEASSNSGSGAGINGYGFSMETGASSGLRFIKCIANNNTASSAGKAVGFHIGVAVIDSIFEDCKSISNSASGDSTLVAGFAALAANTNNSFVNCVASGNTSSTTSASAVVAGFALTVTGCDNNLFDKCVSKANKITGSSGASTCAGFYSLSNANLSFDGCRAIGNSNSSAAGITAGFRFVSTSSSVFGYSNTINACEANGQYTSVAAFTGRVVGIELGDYEKLTTVSNCTVVGNAYTGAAAASAGTGSIYGILLGTTTTGVSRCTVMKNSVRSNAITLYATDTGLTLAGLRDFTTDSNTLIAGNVLALNGFARLSIGSAPNYDIASSDLSANATSGGLNIYLTYDDGQNVADMIVETDVSNMQSLSTGLADWTNYLIVPNQA